MCCPNCFDDRGLYRIVESRVAKGDPRTCDYCGQKSELLIEPHLLSDEFEILSDAYQEDPEGLTLVEHFIRDWGLFPDQLFDVANAKALLAEILDDGEIVRKTFSPIAADEKLVVGNWGELREELRFKNRYFLDQELKDKRLKSLLDQLIAEPLGETWFRARISMDKKPLPEKEMGVPPKGKASHGRANPAGIPYLYMASEPETAVSEIRPHTGEFATVATFKVKNGLNVVDLRNPKTLVSPFTTGLTEEIVRLRADLPFLEALGQELTRPVLPRSAATDYVPSQYLCEFIKKKGFDGVMYQSSVGSGKNLALFNAEVAVFEDAKVYNVERVEVSVVAN